MAASIFGQSADIAPETILTGDLDCLTSERYTSGQLRGFAEQLGLSVPTGAPSAELCRRLLDHVRTLPGPVKLQVREPPPARSPGEWAVALARLRRAVPASRVAALIHQTDLAGLHGILEAGALWPTDRCPNKRFTPDRCEGGVYFTLNTDDNFGQPLSGLQWFCFTNEQQTEVTNCQVALVFSTSLLQDRHDWHLTNGWNYGRPGKQAEESSGPLEFVSYRPRNYQRYLQQLKQAPQKTAVNNNEVVFQHEVPTSYLREVWIRPGDVYSKSHRMPAARFLEAMMDDFRSPASVREIDRIPERFY